jgi:hypothetical protein
MRTCATGFERLPSFLVDFFNSIVADMRGGAQFVHAVQHGGGGGMEGAFPFPILMQGGQ